MKELFNVVFHLPISEGGINYQLNKLVKKAKPAYDMIKHKLQANKKLPIGSDEIDVKVCGEKALGLDMAK